MSSVFTCPTIVHMHPVYLGLSETFIFRIITGLKNFRSIVLTEKLENEDVYHFGEFHTVYEIDKKRNLAYRALAKTLRLLIPAYSEYTWKHAASTHIILANHVKLIHAHFGPSGWFCLPLRRIHRIPLVVSFHGQDVSVLGQQTEWRNRYKSLFNEAAFFTTPSEFIKEKLLKLGCNPSQIKVVHCGIELSKWPLARREIRIKNNSGPNKPVKLLLVGRLVEKKGIEYGIKAVSDVINKYPNIHLNIIGAGPLQASIERQINNLGLGSHIKLLGGVPNFKVAELMRESDILIVPSVTTSNGDTEGLPVVIIEAGAIGLPIIATDHAGIPEIIEDGVTGFLVPERDSDALANRIIRLLQEKGLREEMIINTRKIIENEFNITQSIEQIEQLYNQALENKI